MRFRRVFGLFLDARSAAMIRGYIGRRTQGDCLIYCFSVVSPRVSYLNLNQTFSSWQNDKNYMIAAMRSNRFREILERENRIQLYKDCLEFLKTRVDLDLALFKDDIWSH